MSRTYRAVLIVLSLMLLGGAFICSCTKDYVLAPLPILPSPTSTSTPAKTSVGTATATWTSTFTSTPTPTFTVSASCSNGAVVTTLAGSGSSGFQNGTGTAASFSGPGGMTVDSAGNIYLADESNTSIREITPGGVVTTLAGTGSVGYANGTGTGASFYYPWDLVIDTSGNVYVADQGNQVIRKITSGGVVSTWVGSGTVGFVNGTGTGASFDNPIAMAMDASGNFYVSDWYNNAIRKITPGGVVSTLAGSGSAGSANGTGTSASFDKPCGLTVDGSGNVYVVDLANNLIRKITPGGVVTTLAGSGSAGFQDGTGTGASFNYPEGIAIDTCGNLYVADYGNDRVRKIAPGGVVTTLAGSGSASSIDGTGTAASFDGPSGIAVDSSMNIYVSDFQSDKIRKIH